MGIKINDKHSYDDYGLILSSKTIPSPQVKKVTVDIPAGDGQIDFTEAFGEVKFKNRPLTFNFSKVFQTLSDFMSWWSDFTNELEGQKVDIILDEDPDFHYVGRIANTYSKKKNIYTIKMTVDCDPYRLKNDVTIVTKSGSGTVELMNLRKKVVPKITTSAETRIEFNNKQFNLSAGVWTIPELELSKGINSVVVTTTGTVEFKYQEGGL